MDPQRKLHVKVQIYSVELCFDFRIYFSGILFCIGAVIDEPQGHQQIVPYISHTSGSKARLVLVLKWMLVGCLLTMSYKAVLRARLISTQYEKPIDTLDDVLESKMPVRFPGDTGMTNMLKTDPREIVRQELSAKAKPYIFGIQNPDWVQKGY